MRSIPILPTEFSTESVDLMWGFHVNMPSHLHEDHTTISDNNPFYFEGPLLHELGHTRYLIDVYGFNVGGEQVALNLIAGHRALRENYNALHNLGSFLQNLPQENILTITSPSGAPLAGASVRIYQATSQAATWYGKYSTMCRIWIWSPMPMARFFWDDVHSAMMASSLTIMSPPQHRDRPDQPRG